MVARAPANEPAPVAAVHRSDLDPAEFLHLVLDTVPGGVFTVDPAGTITSWNRAMEGLTGFTALEMLGQPCTALAGDTCVGGACADGQARCALFREGEVRGRRCSLRRRDGTRVTVLKNARVFRGEGGRVLGGLEALADLSGLVRLEQQLSTLREAAAGRARFDGLVGTHPEMGRLHDVIELAGRSSLPVLVLGETGTGKELVARAVHRASDRRDGPFVRVSCAALTELLLERELFGFPAGAAGQRRGGRLEAARGGTLFLDEIADVSPPVQTLLLRMLQEREHEERAPGEDVRIVASTNANLIQLCERGGFRRDLYYRLAVVPIEVPPLRERPTDVPVLVDHFLGRLNQSLGRTVRGVTPEALRRLVAYRWPGNVRELQHAIEYAFVLSRREEIDVGELPPAIAAPAASPFAAAKRRSSPDRERIADALRRTDGSRTEAARLLGVSRVTLWKWMRALEMDAE